MLLAQLVGCQSLNFRLCLLLELEPRHVRLRRRAHCPAGGNAKIHRHQQTMQAKVMISFSPSSPIVSSSKRRALLEQRRPIRAGS